ncbi:MAG: serine hydrolase [Planctomycetota bacterium]|nr:MAG: serine hydrolase [Planctomycetota bacterium]
MDTIYLTFLIVGLFSMLLGALAALLPKKLTVWEQRLCGRLGLISESKLTRPVKGGKFILERLLGCLLLIFGIAAIYYLPIKLSLQLGSDKSFTLALGGAAKMANFEQLPSVSPDSGAAKGLHIIRAGYGAGNTWLDVSKKIREKVRENALSIKASNEIAGDPLSGKVKILKVEYVLDGGLKTAEVQEGRWLHIPSDVERHPEVQAVQTKEQLVALVKQCPGEVGFFGKNLWSGETVEYRADQPACLASIVKIFVLLEVMRQADEGTLELSGSITIEREDEKEICTISEALDKMIGVSDNEATSALATRVGWDCVNALPSELGISGLSDKILPEAGVLGKALDKRVYSKNKLCSLDNLLPQHGAARGIVQYFELLGSGRLLSESISRRVLDVFDRNPKNFAPGATPKGFKSGGKGGSCAWIRPGRPPYNMTGWGLLIRNENSAVALCLWCEWFPEEMSEELKRKWCFALSDSIVNILLGQDCTDVIQRNQGRPAKPGEEARRLARLHSVLFEENKK